MTKNDLKKLIREVVAIEIKALRSNLAVVVTKEVKKDLLREIKADMFDVLTSNRLPAPAPLIETNAPSPTVTGGRQDLRALFEQANPNDFVMGESVAAQQAPVIATVADLPPTAEHVTTAGVELYKKLLSGGN